MKLSQFKFQLPEELIAQFPAPHREDARMMVVNRTTGEIQNRVFSDILEYYQEADVMVFNDTRTFPAKLIGTKEKNGARIEVFLLRELNADNNLWDVLVEPARKIRIGNKLFFGPDESMVAEVIDNTTSRGRTLRFLYDGSHEQFKRELFSLGQTPLPEYIHRDPVPEDAEDYQCIFAAKEGAVVTPAAGMHFSRVLMKQLEIKGVDCQFVTVHSGLGNFRQIDVEDLTKHRMDAEEIDVPASVVEHINHAKDTDHKVCAVGTSVLRAMATAVAMGSHLRPYQGWTNKFIFPPYDFTVATSLVSNFHLPLSTMLMMVAAFGGYDLIMKAYGIAVKEGYRFGAYGDAMLVIS